MRIFSAILMAACVASCAVPSKDVTPSEAAIKGPQRIVTLNGVLTEVVCALGLQDHVVGTDVTSKYPEAVISLPKLGHDKAIRAEGILSLSPSIVMANVGQLDPAVEGQLRQAGIRLMLFTPRNSIDGSKQLIAQVADSLGRGDVARSIDARIDSAMSGISPLTPSPKVLFIYARGAGTLLVAGMGTPMQSLISLAGGTNAIEGFTEFKPLTPEALVDANPDVVLYFNTGADDLQGDQALMRVPGMASTGAGRNGAFIPLTPVVMAGFGPRVGNAVSTLNADLVRLSKK